MYIGPLKALINDQWWRLTELCEQLEVQVTPWHGDITATRKEKFQRDPSGCLLITPESLEGLLMRNGHSLSALFGRLQWIVIDELHAFMGNVRGKQLQSLLHRIELALGRSVTRIGLSATLGDMRLAAEFLRPGDGGRVDVIESRHGGQELKVIVKGVYEAENVSADDTSSERQAESGGIWDVADDLFRLRGHNNLVFPNSRRNVELLADRLRECCEGAHVPNEFWPHHGSLSKSLREETERALKLGDRPATAIATTTLELGIDIGKVKSVAQVGPAPSVASLRQRLGRSGRRPGEPAILRAYCIESKVRANSPLSDQLREGLIETIAQIRLLVRGWYEPPAASTLHLSTLIQQLLALIAQYGGLRPSDAWHILFESEVFHGLNKGEFADLLRELGTREVVQQDSSGVLLHGPLGDRIVNHYSFLAAFVGDEEFRIVTDGKTLGSLPLSRPLAPGTFIIFAGRRWRVLDCIPAEKVVHVAPARSGQVPKFDGAGGKVHDEVRREMRRVLGDAEPITFADPTAIEQLAQARESYERLQLDEWRVLEAGKEVRVLTWRGDAVNDTLAVWLNSMELPAANEGLAVIVFDVPRARVVDALVDIGDSPAPRVPNLAASVRNLIAEKWDSLLPPPLLRKTYGSREFDIDSTQRVCREIAAAEP